jgi:hypothetical protein
MRRWLVVLNDPKFEFSSPAELEDHLKALLDWQLGEVAIAAVERGGIMAEKILGELVPVRHARMGRGRSE